MTCARHFRFISLVSALNKGSAFNLMMPCARGQTLRCLHPPKLPLQSHSLLSTIDFFEIEEGAWVADKKFANMFCSLSDGDRFLDDHRLKWSRERNPLISFAEKYKRTRAVSRFFESFTALLSAMIFCVRIICDCCRPHDLAIYSFKLIHDSVFVRTSSFLLRDFA